ncbi:response regulator [Longispora sp. NPDC051575]|uniref:response regulator n=1 Tax=Longispora sp. NPDC051575 TaxID=3154943 RepID=UPI0034258DA0
MSEPVAPIRVVLLVEDDPGDELMTREAFADNGFAGHLHVVRDGRAALDFLHQRGEHTGVPRPDLVLLDLNLPFYSGREVLTDIKSDPDLVTIPVVVLTTSRAEDDVLAAYRAHANAYVNKPVNFDRFIEVIAAIDGFFIAAVHLPPR